MKALNPPATMFANLLEPPTVLDDVAVAALLVLGIAPAVLFLLLVALAPTPPACRDDAGISHQVGTESQRRQAPSLSTI